MVAAEVTCTVASRTKVELSYIAHCTYRTTTGLGAPVTVAPMTAEATVDVKHCYHNRTLDFFC